MEAHRAAARLEARLALQVRAGLASWGRQLSTAVRASPQSSLASLLARYDISHALAAALRSGEQQAEAAVRQAWALSGEPPSSTYLSALLADVQRAYAAAEAQLAAALTAAFHSVPDASFQPGVSEPGSNPQVQAAGQRAAAVRAAVASYAAGLSLRNRLTVGVAAAAGQTAAVLAEAERRAAAGEDIRLRWVTSHQPPDATTCQWCSELNGHEVRPGQQFPHPHQAGSRRPPRLYQGTLFGPCLHPHCRCKLVIVTGTPQPPPAKEPAEVPSFISSDTIRALPQDKYDKLHHFLRSALHELGQVLRRILSLG